MDPRKEMAELKSAMEGILERAKAEDRDVTPEEATEIEKKADRYNELKAQVEKADHAKSLVDSLAKAAPEPVESSPITEGGVGRAFVESDAYKAFRKGGEPGSGVPIHIEAKGIATLADLGLGRKELTSESGQIRATREPGYRNYLPVDEPTTFLNLVTTGSTDVAWSEYAQIVAETNNAAIVPEGELKPLSDLETATAESRAFVYADGFVVTNQSLADDGALAAFMETRIRVHVRGIIEHYLLNGTGGTGEPRGILNTSGTLSQDFDTDVITTLSRALETFEANNGNTEVQAIVMNPRDVWNLRLQKDGNDNYQLGNPLQQGLVPTPWGVPIVRSNKVDQGTALVGRFDSVQYLELEPINVLAFNQHEDFARRNKVYVRCESRGRQLFYAPRELVVATISNGGGGGGVEG